MTAPVLLVGLERMHHDMRWASLCRELGLDVKFHSMSGLTASLTGIANGTTTRTEANCLSGAEAQRRALADLIDAIEPFAVHALGSHPAGFLAQDALELARSSAALVIHIRGGAELELYRHSAEHEARFHTLFPAASAVIADNESSYRRARVYGFTDPLGLDFSVSVPGNCGEVPAKPFHSKKESNGGWPIVLWPKAFVSPNTDPYPIIEAVARLWRSGRRFRLVAFGMDWPELQLFARHRFPDDCHSLFEARPFTQREEFLEILQGADVLLCPTMFDGISNVLLEGMAAGLVPVVTRHPGLPPDLVALQGILFAENLVVSEIEAALTNALDLSETERETWSIRNAEWVAWHCNRPRLVGEVSSLYSKLGGNCRATRETTP